MVGTPLPSSSLIICTRDRSRLLIDTIHSVLAGDEIPTEIVIMDQSAAPDPSVASLPAPSNCSIRHIPSDSVGLSRARNQAIAHARHDIMVITDDDMRATPGWYGAIVRGLVEAGPRSVVTGPFRAGPPEVPGGYAPEADLGSERLVFEGRIYKDILATGNMAISRSTIEEIGAFDELLGAGSRFPGADDNDYGHRLLERGYRIVYVPEAIVYHRAWRTPQDTIRLEWRYGRGQGAFQAKHARLRDPYMLRRFAGEIAIRLCKIPYQALRLRLRWALGNVANLAGQVSGFAGWSLIRLRDRTIE